MAPAFTADTAARTGRSERAVQRDAERGEKVALDVLTPLLTRPAPDPDQQQPETAARGE